MLLYCVLPVPGAGTVYYSQFLKTGTHKDVHRGVAYAGRNQTPLGGLAWVPFKTVTIAMEL